MQCIKILVKMWEAPAASLLTALLYIIYDSVADMHVHCQVRFWWVVAKYIQPSLKPQKFKWCRIILLKSVNALLESIDLFT